MVLKTFKADDNEVVSNNSDKTNKIIVNLFKNNISKILMCMPNIGAIRKPTFLTFNAKKVFNHLKQAFIKALIFQHFDLEKYV